MKQLLVGLLVGMVAVTGWAEVVAPYYTDLFKQAEAGDIRAQAYIGWCYGVGKDEKEAVKWFTKSAEQGNEDAQKALGMLKSKTP